MEQEEITQFDQNDTEDQNIKGNRDQVLDSFQQRKMIGFMIIIVIINLLQTLFNLALYYNLIKFNNYNNNNNTFYFHPTSQDFLTFVYPIMIIIVKCFQKSTIYKKLSVLTFLIFFISFGISSSYFFIIFLQSEKINENQNYELIFFNLAIADLIAAYSFYSIYLCFTNYLIKRNFQILVCISTIILTILSFIFINIQTYNIQTYNFQYIISTLYFQGIMTLYLLIQLEILFETLNNDFKLQIYDILDAYMQIQTRIFLFCFKN